MSTLALVAAICCLSAASDPVPAAPDVSPLVTEGIITAPIDQVWRVFSTPEGFKAFGPAQCDMDFRVGGLIRTHYDPKGTLGDEGTIVNQIIAYEPPRMLAFRIHTPPKGFPFMSAYKDTWSVATLTDMGDGTTHLRLAGLGYTAGEESQKMRAFFESGNAWSLKKLQSHFDASASKPAGPAHADNPLAPIVHEGVISAPRSEVWRWISSSEGWKSFIGVASRIGSTPGEPFEIYFDIDAPEGQRGSEGCTVLSLDPERMFSFTWNAPPKFAHARQQRTWVVVTLVDLDPARTRVTLRHLGFAEQAAKHPDHAQEWRDVRAYFQNAWGMVMGALKQRGEAGSAK